MSSLPFPKPHAVRLKGKEMTALRIACYQRDGGRCTACGCRLYLESFNPLMHMHHIRGRGVGGSDVLENVRSLCPECHLVGAHNPKSVPPKGRL